ncbi:precorrin-2 dehydrogenase / sirohydrochlorin ferrochelatase [Flavobacterium glycines]|uniref:precorrin-2 dehydrogenase n=1 Tax=Flavobacterium glycines TaxID=551990 RepID=A0A1B9DN15_9FLAO|nr:bifunctional precorrin-2 dehydrogenase/sirohydrochlorin ferrochelatase [Flavobacterium glycines]OCB71087.1 siroheme synthase [Flavobacterium glycines]GEL10903.1 siroheme synthase [Flavobacterium glycines]SDI49457.1 precorrin-2 dehydrogenase / sirohydrochlorin ferrochelatase [Flavobacterium glycines]
MSEIKDTAGNDSNSQERNELYPIFLKLHNLSVLIVGGGNVGLEKLSFLLKSSPNAKVEVVAPRFIDELVTLAEKHPAVKLTNKKFKKKMLKKRNMVIACTDDLKVNKRVYELSRKRYLICNIADTPDLCDYYLGGIVTKGNVKIAISTNGKSPTTAKRLREFFEEVIPEDINQMVQNLNDYRNTLKGDFEDKVQKMNEITQSLKNK